MPQTETARADFWAELERDVALSVEFALRYSEASRAPLIAHLRDIEGMVRTECDDRQTIQILASARRLLGDQERLGPGDGPSALGR